MIKNQLKKITIKPISACTANCPTCANRKNLHHKLLSEKTISFDQWKKILEEASKLGLKNLYISGGEPTLYKHLTDLVEIGKSYGLFVNINSNGSQITKEYAEWLLKAGLDSIMISLYSPIPEVHNSMRDSKNLWSKAVSAVKIFSNLEKKYPNFKVRTQTLLCRENYRSFPDLLKLHYDLGSNGIVLSYLEGDFEKKYLLNENEIKYFRENVIPEAIKFCDNIDEKVRGRAIKVIRNLFSKNILKTSEWAKGIYRPNYKNKPCSIPKKYAMILSNGDVHPCNVVEYTHDPLMGNLFKNSLKEIWNGKKWDYFRKNLFEKCQLCPINLHKFIPLRG
jgi:MoaA/NifB/PqqE/SkfB family radical SAM enzyme